MIFDFLKLIKAEKLILIAFVQFLIKFFFLSGYGFTTALSPYDLGILMLSTSLLMGAGYTTCKLDDTTFKFNSKLIFLILSGLSIIIITYLSFKINKPFYCLIFITLVIILYAYDNFLKKRTFINNILVSIYLAICILVVLWFDSPTSLNAIQWDLFLNIEFICVFYAIVWFFYSLIKEIIEDIKNVNQDYNLKTRESLPVVLGVKKATGIVICIIILTIAFIIAITTVFFNYKFMLIIVYAFGVFPLFYLIYRLINVQSNKDYIFLSSFIKLITLVFILTIPIVSYYIKNVIE